MVDTIVCGFTENPSGYNFEFSAAHSFAVILPSEPLENIACNEREV